MMATGWLMLIERYAVNSRKMTNQEDDGDRRVDAVNNEKMTS